MQHERELRSDIDHLMDILRANPKTRFTITKLESLTGLPESFLKKWVDVLEERGHIRFFYNISDEQFSWISENVPRIEEAPSKIEAVGENGKTPGMKLRTYCKGEENALIEDMKNTVASAKILRARICTLKKAGSPNLAAIRIAQHRLDEKKKEISHLLEQAKHFRG